jgi:hypothetical protein
MCAFNLMRRRVLTQSKPSRCGRAVSVHESSTLEIDKVVRKLEFLAAGTCMV